MLYTISIKNLNGLNKVGQNLINFNQVSPISVSSPETPYDSFISDTRYNLDGFVQIPLYNRQQYCNIPPNSILTITTENSTEAIYYSTIKIDGGSVTVDPDPYTGKGGRGTDDLGKMLLERDFENGTLHIPGDITLLGTGIVIGPKLYNVELESLNSIPKERSAGNILYVNTDIQFPGSSEFEDVTEYFDNDSNKITQTKDGYFLYTIDILNNFTFEELRSVFSFFGGYRTAVVPFFSIPQQVYSSDSEVASYIEIIEQELGCKIIDMIMTEGAIFVKTENDVPDDFKVCFMNINKQTGEILFNTTSNIQYTQSESYILVYSWDDTQYVDNSSLVAVSIQELVDISDDIYVKTGKTQDDKIEIYQLSMTSCYKTIPFIEWEGDKYYKLSDNS